MKPALVLRVDFSAKRGYCKAFIPNLFDHTTQLYSQINNHTYESAARAADRTEAAMREISEAKDCSHFFFFSRSVIVDKKKNHSSPSLFLHLCRWKCILSKHMFQSQSSL